MLPPMRERTMARTTTRRLLLQMLGGATLLVAGGSRCAFAQNAGKIAPLIVQARPLEPISARIAFISRAFIGTRYVSNTLIGGPRRPEQFVVRDDAFDCVTYCETVLAAALARDYDEFETALKKIRYANGDVRWDERNHYFAEWCRSAVEKKICRPIALPETVTIDKAVNFGNLGRRQVTMQCVPSESLLARPSQLANGDVIGFVSRRSNLDFFHTGLVMLSAKGEVILRNASQSRGRVLDMPMERFVAASKVEYATLLRPIDQAHI
jgi:hypothetical protein